MLIRCSDSCKFQEDGFCGLKNIYSNKVSSFGGIHEINETGCAYYQPKSKNKTNKKIPDNIINTNTNNNNINKSNYL